MNEKYDDKGIRGFEISFLLKETPILEAIIMNHAIYCYHRSVIFYGLYR